MYYAEYYIYYCPFVAVEEDVNDIACYSQVGEQTVGLFGWVWGSAPVRLLLLSSSSSSASSDESWGFPFPGVKRNQTFGDEMHGSKALSCMLYLTFTMPILNRFSKIPRDL